MKWALLLGACLALSLSGCCCRNPCWGSGGQAYGPTSAPYGATYAPQGYQQQVCPPECTPAPCNCY